VAERTTFPSPTPIRAGATRAEVYNEGLAVYLYDPASRQAIIGADGVELVEAALNGSNTKPVKALAKRALLVAYELQQDDSLTVDVAVGPPLSKEELKAVPGAKWHKPQVSVLDLPSGQFTIETANSSHINPGEDPDEPGAIIPVPPGRYVVTLYRLKWSDMPEEVGQRVRDAGVGEEFIVLTPFAQTEKPPKTWPLGLPFPVGNDSVPVGKYKIDGPVFAGQIWFWDFWEIFWLNLDRKAAADLGIDFGSVLDIETGGRRFTAVYLNQAIQFSIPHVAGYKPFVGHDRTLAPVAGEPELALAVFQPHPVAEVDVLACMRIQANSLVEQTWHEKWRKATATLRPERLPHGDGGALGNWTKKGSVLQGEALLTGERFLSVNLDAAALKAIGARPGDRLLLAIDGHEHALTLYADVQSYLAAVQKRRPSFLSSERDARWEKIKDKWIVAKEADKPTLVQQMRAHLLPDPPLAIYPDTHWYTPDKGILLIQPDALDMETYKLKFTLPFQIAPGAPVTLKKA
jgi:hypothetical protein